MTDVTPTPGTPIDENHPGLCHKAHPGVRHGEWERERRGYPPFRGMSEQEHVDLHEAIAEVLASGGPVEDEMDAATEVMDLLVRRRVIPPTPTRYGLARD